MEYASGVGGTPYSRENLHPEVTSYEWCTLKKAKVGEDAYIYVPSKPVEKGFYLIDYKKGDKAFLGYNSIHIQ